MSKLNLKQQLFIEEYLVDLNATQAAKRAGYSEKTAYSIGQENLNKPEIQEAVQKAFNERSERTEITQDYVLGTIKETVEKCKESDNTNGILKGCELLGKHLKLFTDKVEHSGDVNINIQRFTDEGE